MRPPTAGCDRWQTGIASAGLPSAGVVTAEKQAQTNLIRRREETAATRSPLNTAKLMEDNPLLVRLKELETLEKVAEKVGKLTVFGGLLERTIKLG
jgi:hypothetical protein